MAGPILTSEIVAGLQAAAAAVSSSNPVTTQETTALTYRTGNTGAIPTFVGNIDPTEDPDTAALVIAGAIWVDTTYGPPYAQWYRTDGDIWQSSAFVAYDNMGTPTTQVGSSLGLALMQYGTTDEAVPFGQVSVGPGSVAMSATDAAHTSNPAIGITTGEGEPGQVFIDLSDGVSNLLIPDLPTADPEVAGGVWNSGGALAMSGSVVGTQAANIPAIDPEVTAADAAFNDLRTAMIASGLMAPDV